MAAGEIARLRWGLAREAGTPGPLGPPGPGGDETAVAIYFTFASSSPQILQAIPTGAIFTEVVVAVETPFNTPASCLVGVAANPGLFLGSSDSDLTQVGQYESDVLVSIPTIELLILTLNAGGATLGSGVVFYRYLNP